MQLQFSNMSVEEVNTGHISPGTYLAAFRDSSGIPSVIYQAKGNMIHTARIKNEAGKLPWAGLTPKFPVFFFIEKRTELT